MTPLHERIESILQYLLTEAPTRRSPSKEGNIQLHKILNPTTGRQINVGTALGYDPSSPAYQAAKAYMDQHRGGKGKPEPDKEKSISTKDITKQHSLRQQKIKAGKQLRDTERDSRMAVLNGKVKSQGQTTTSTGPVHEVSIGYALELMQYTDLDDEEIVNKITDDIKDTRLGKQLVTKRKNGTENYKRLQTVIKYAVNSARAEQTRIEYGIANNKMNPDKSISQHFHGNDKSQENLKKELLNLVEAGYSLVTSEASRIDPRDVESIIKDSGTSSHKTDMSNPADTFIVTIDPSSKKVIFSLSGNKTQPTDQTFNSTVLKEITDYRNSLKQLVASSFLDDTQLDTVSTQLDKTDAIINRLSAEVNSLFGAPVNKLLTDKNANADFHGWVRDTASSKDRTDKNIGKYYAHALRSMVGQKTARANRPYVEQAAKELGGNPDKPTAPILHKAWLLSMQGRLSAENGKITSNEQKLISRYFQSARGSRYNTSVDTTKVRMAALKALQNRHKALSGINAKINGKTIPVSKVVLGIFASRALHLEEALHGTPGVDKKSIYRKYPCLYKTVAGDVVGYQKSIHKALQTRRFDEFCEQLTLSEPQIAKKQGTESEAGTIVFDIMFAGKMPLLHRAIRTKGGNALNITVVPSKEYMEKLADNQPKPKLHESILTEDTTPSYYKRFHGVPPEILSRELTYNPIDPKTGRLRIDAKTGAPKVQKVKLSNVLFTPSKYQKYPALVNMAHNMAAPYMDRQKKADTQPDDAPMPEPGISTATPTQGGMASTMGGSSHKTDTPSIGGSSTFTPPPVPKIGHVLPRNHHDAIKAQLSVQMLKHLSPYKNKRMAEKHLALLLITVLYHFKKHKKSILRKYFGGRGDFMVLKRLAKQIAETFPQDQQMISAAVDTLDSNGGDIVFTFKEDVIRVVDFDGFAKGLRVHVEGDAAEQRVGKLMTKLLPINVLQQGSTFFFIHDILSPVDDLSLIGSGKLETETGHVIYSVMNINPTDLLIATSNEQRDGYFITFADDFKELLDLV